MPNDTLDEIEARWKDCEQDEFIDLDPSEQVLWVAIGDIHALIEMVRARDGTLREIMAIARGAADETLAAPGAPGWTSICAIAQIAKAALDTPPAQEPTE